MRFSAARLNILWYLLLSAFWGGSYIGIKELIKFVDPVAAASLRVLLAAFALWIILKVRGKSFSVEFHLMRKIWLIGFFALTLPFCCLFWAEKTISPGLAGIVCASVPIWTFILSFVMTPKTAFYSTQRLIGLLIGLFGVCIIFWPLIKIKADHQELMGCIAAIAMSVSYAIGALLNQKILAQHKLPFESNVFHQLISSGMTLLIVALLFKQVPFSLHVFHHVSFLVAWIYLGVISTAIAWMLFYFLIEQWGAVRASTATFVAPAAAVLWDYLIFVDVPTASEIAGIMVILAGVMMLQFAPGKKFTDDKDDLSKSCEHDKVAQP